jgi:hypothetical protein
VLGNTTLENGFNQADIGNVLIGAGISSLGHTGRNYKGKATQTKHEANPFCNIIASETLWKPPGGSLWSVNLGNYTACSVK